MALPFLREQLKRSLANLGLGCVDVLYLHNAAESWLPEIGYGRFVEKLWEVFALYEEERRKGRILYYGMASWSCFRVREGRGRAREPGGRGGGGEGASAERSTASGSCSSRSTSR